MSGFDEIMNTPPRSTAPSYHSSEYSRAPRRSQLECSVTPPKIRTFEEIDYSFSKEFEMERQKHRKREKENELKCEIKEMIKDFLQDKWLFEGGVEYLHTYPYL
mmetsp:Transcript_12508/g.18226  ORF Transcript_12508/g.18226 Transcript_12508/m.18226 type:complete len:104 (+) Transcript_12508:10-321(+)